MNDIEKQISAAAFFMALTFIVVFVGVILIGVFGGELGAMFVKLLLIATFFLFFIGGVFLELKYLFTRLLKNYIAYKESENH